MQSWITAGLACALSVATALPARAERIESQRLERAKDLIAEEQWLPAIRELSAAANDPKEPDRDEALFWLAHSQNQASQAMAALESIGRLERAFPESRWMKPAQSLRLEIAQQLGRFDVLWRTARPAPPPPAPPPPPRPAPPAGAPPAPPSIAPRPVPGPMHGTTPRVVTISPADPADPVSVWITPTFVADMDLRIQALGSLIRTDAEKVIPILKEIALDAENPRQARRALFVLAQSGRPEAHTTVAEVARTATEPVRIAAVRELGRLRGPNVSKELMTVYSTGNAPVKFQVVTALGQRAELVSLMRIVQQETNRHIRDAAITTLGVAGGRDHLRRLYARSTAETKRPIIIGLFNAKADEELIRIARTERDAAIRAEVLTKLRLLGTPGAEAFLRTVKSK